MPQHTYYLLNTSEDALTLQWGFNWKALKIFFGGEMLGEIATKKELAQGREFHLPGNRTLHVKLKGNFMPELEVLVDDQPVAGSATDPKAVINQLFKLSLILGMLNGGLGIIGTIWASEFFRNLGFGAEQIFIGVLVIGLAFGIRKRSMVALVASICFWVLDYALQIFFAIQEGSSTNPGLGLVMRMVIVYSLYRGIGALKSLKKQETELQTV